MIRTRLATFGKLALAAVVVVLASCGTARPHSGAQTATTATLAANGSAIAWLDDPVSPSTSELTSKPLPSAPIRDNAPPCLSQNLSVVTQHLMGISEDEGPLVEFRNTGRTSCTLKATPKVEATAPGHAPFVATTEPLPSYGEIANIAPGGTVNLEVDDYIACTGGAEEGLPVYTSLVIDIPGGGSKVINGLDLAFPCGMQNTPFWVEVPTPVYPANPLVGLVPELHLPKTVMPGTRLDFAVSLVNHSDQLVSLSPCPAYLEYSSVPDSSFTYRLNCRTVHAIPAHGQVNYQMELAIPANAFPGTTKVFWSLVGVETQLVHAQLQVG